MIKIDSTNTNLTTIPPKILLQPNLISLNLSKNKLKVLHKLITNIELTKSKVLLVNHTN